MDFKRLTRAQMSKKEKEVTNLPEDLRRSDPLLVPWNVLDSYATRERRERARTFFEPDDEAYLKGEQGYFYFVIVGDYPKRVHRVIRLYFAKKLGLRAIAKLLGIKYRTAQRDWERAMPGVARRLEQLGRAGRREK